MTPGSLLCICRLDGKESATAVPANLDKYGVKIFRSRAERARGAQKSKSNSEVWAALGIASRMLPVARVCQLLGHREDEGFVYDVTLGTHTLRPGLDANYRRGIAMFGEQAIIELINEFTPIPSYWIPAARRY
jgi:hypothetical protein